MKLLPTAQTLCNLTIRFCLAHCNFSLHFLLLEADSEVSSQEDLIYSKLQQAVSSGNFWMRGDIKSAWKSF